MGNELGNETGIDLLLVPPIASPPNFALIENDDFITEFGWNLGQKLVFLSVRRYLVELESNYKHVIICMYLLFLHMH